MPAAATSGGETVVGVGDSAVSNDRSAVLVTYALGSCIGLALYDASARVGGLLHFLLPDSSLGTDLKRRNPDAYCDSGVERLIQRCLESGAARSRLVATAAGGARVLLREDYFEVGRKNQEAVEATLSRARIPLVSRHMGGTSSRTMRLDIQCGTVIIYTGNGRGAQ